MKSYDTWLIAIFSLCFVIYMLGVGTLAFDNPFRHPMGNYESAIACPHRFCGVWVHGRVHVVHARDGVKVFWR
jgi:hypothetical protein